MLWYIVMIPGQVLSKENTYVGLYDTIRHIFTFGLKLRNTMKDKHHLLWGTPELTGRDKRLFIHTFCTLLQR